MQINTLNIFGASTLHSDGATRNLLVTNYNPVVTPTLDNIVISGACTPVDTTPPTVSLTTSGSACGDTFIGSVTITVTASDT
jgi:hypothetical protein